LCIEVDTDPEDRKLCPDIEDADCVCAPEECYRDSDCPDDDSCEQKEGEDVVPVYVYPSGRDPRHKHKPAPNPQPCFVDMDCPRRGRDEDLDGNPFARHHLGSVHGAQPVCRFDPCTKDAQCHTGVCKTGRGPVGWCHVGRCVARPGADKADDWTRLGSREALRGKGSREWLDPVTGRVRGTGEGCLQHSTTLRAAGHPPVPRIQAYQDVVVELGVPYVFNVLRSDKFPLEGADPPVRRQIVYVALDAISGYDRVMTAQSTTVIVSGVLLLLAISFIIAALMLIIKAHIRWKLKAVYQRAEVAGVKGHLEERAKKSATLVAARDGKLSELVKKNMMLEAAKRANKTNAKTEEKVDLSDPKFNPFAMPKRAAAANKGRALTGSVRTRATQKFVDIHNAVKTTNALKSAVEEGKKKRGKKGGRQRKKLSLAAMAKAKGPKS